MLYTGNVFWTIQRKMLLVGAIYEIQTLDAS